MPEKKHHNTVIDHDLLVELKNGNEDAFRQIFTRWEKPLFIFISKLTGSPSDAEDICQETFASLWIHRSSIDPSKNIKNLIFLITRQITWKRLRKNKRMEDFIANCDFEDSDNISPEHIMQLHEFELLTELVINKLPPRMREIYNLHYKECLSYEQIAEMLNTNTVNVKTQIYQARMKLKEIITP